MGGDAGMVSIAKRIALILLFLYIFWICLFSDGSKDGIEYNYKTNYTEGR